MKASTTKRLYENIILPIGLMLIAVACAVGFTYLSLWHDKKFASLTLICFVAGVYFKIKNNKFNGPVPPSI